jgi:RNA polymerase sigma factor (sigma-70 family)
MSAADSQRLVQHIRRLAGDPSGTPSDGELLRRYLESREDAAFAALMRRHGPMVFSVCQSVLRQREDAEDAFQAAFLILARKAGSVRRHESLAGWLQRIAYRIALSARTDKLRRQEREAKTARSIAVEPSGDDLSWGEMRAILHAALATLPESFRAPLVLCYLEGRTQEEAAQRLGWSLSTVRGRVQRGRDKLRRRLERRGVTLTAALAAALTGQTLAEAAGPSAALPTAAALAMARGFLRPALPIKLVLLLSLGVIAGGMALRWPAEPQPFGNGGEDRALTVAAPKEAIDTHGDPLPEGAVARLGTVRFNHGDGLNALFFSADGKTIFSEGNGSIRIWNANDGKERDRLPTAKTHFFHDPIIFLPDGQTFITLLEGGDNDVAHFYNLTRKIETHTQKLPLKRRVFSAFHVNALSPDGKLAVSHVHTPPEVQVFDLTTGKHLYQLAKGEKEFLTVAFAGNDRIVSGDKNKNLEVWEARTSKLLHQVAHESPIGYLLASPDGRWLASLSERPSPYGRNIEQEIVYLWDMNTLKVTQSLRAKPKYWFTNICFSPDGKTVLTSTRSSSPEVNEGDEIVHWDRATGRKLLTFTGDSGIVADITTISPDGSRLAAGNRAGKIDLWDLKTGHLFTSEDSRHLRYVSVVLAPNGERATILGNESISSWDATRGRRLDTVNLPHRTFSSQCISSDGRYAVTFQLKGNEYCMSLWDLVARKSMHTMRFPGGYQHDTCAFTPDSSLLALWRTGDPPRVRIWDVQSGKQVCTFEETKAGYPGKMHFTHDGKTLFVAGKRVAAYEVASGKELFSWRLKPLADASGFKTDAAGGGRMQEEDRIGWRTLAFSPDGRRIAALMWGDFSYQPQEKRLALYDAHTGKLLRRWNDSGHPTPQYEQMAFSHDGQLLASSDGNSVHLWEAATSKLIHTFKGHQGDIHALAFSRDGRRLASASNDSTVLIWDLTGQPENKNALTEAKLKECWNDLAGEDAGRAHRAVWTLIRAPRAAIPFLKVNLHPVKPVRREQIEQWIQDLDAGSFEVRQKASAELEKLGELAEESLRRTLANKPTLEQRRRIEPMLAKLDTAIPSGESLQALRAVRAVEHIATSEARQLLRELAAGAEGAWLTREAKAALMRTDSSSSGASP